MIVWLASYPRSGNTLLRLVLKEAFGKFTYSEYNDLTDIGDDRALARKVNHVSYPMSWDAYYELARKKPKLYLVKTHGPPKDDAPAIYVLRDGRAASVSYRHYLNNYGKLPTTLRDVVLGSVEFGSWSQHIESWLPTSRPKTLFLRYEDMLDDLGSAIKRISAFLDIPIKGDLTTSFESLHEKFPNFFRSGKREAEPEAFDAVDAGLFDLLHGPAMDSFGYGRAASLDRDALRQAVTKAGADAAADRRRRSELEEKNAELDATLKRKWKEIGGLNARIQILDQKVRDVQLLRQQSRDMADALLGGPKEIWKMRRNLKNRRAKPDPANATSSPIAADQPAARKAPLGIALFGFNRSKLIENSLESLARQGKLGQVHLWIDGDQGNPARRRNTEAVFEVAKRYDVKKIHRHRGNLGFRKMMLQTMAYMSLHYDKIIFLEDDCFPTRNCIDSFDAELEAVRDRADVFSVYGHHFGLAHEDDFFPRFQGWGWATTSDKLRPVLDDLTQCFLMTEERFLSFTRDAMTPAILKRIDVTPGRQPSITLKAFFAWDETLCLLTALRGQVHKRSAERIVYNCGAGDDSTHFAEVESFRRPPFNMIAPSEVWDHF
jgi:hypothetical protein